MSNVARFTINGLFEVHNVTIPFDNKVKILIGENGLGKTTILNALYYVLTKKWHKLVKIPFQNIEVKFENNSRIFFSKMHLEAYLVDDKRQRKRGHVAIINQLREIVGDIQDVKAVLIKNNELNQQDILNYIIHNKLNQRIAAPVAVLVDALTRLITDEFVLIFDTINKIIDEQLDSTILYFPTYRRVEEELQNLGQIKRIHHKDYEYEFESPFDQEEKLELSSIEEETLIQFGMEDVEIRIKKILSHINDTSLNGFSKVTGELLSQMLKTFPVVTPEVLGDLKKEEISIILNRVKNNLPDQDMQNILGIVESSQFAEKKDLVFFLTKLIEIYRDQKVLDDSIKTFVTVCNKYLVGKRMYFNESSVTLDILRDKTEKRVKLNQLSSGEKQIVSLFSKIYLEQHENFTVLFDEPELSLSIEWQKMLLPDIISSQKCKFLLAVTHSPFIFKNELDIHAIGMNIYID
jgi:predicted ATP-binding protein involved in virulence